MPDNFPAPVTERHGKFIVVRDDLHPGGTKEIVLRKYLPELQQKHFVYVASAFGKGGAALAHACAALGFRATLFMSKTKIQPQWIDNVKKLGTTIIWMDLMPVTKIENDAWDHAMQVGGYYLPLGFDDARFQELLTQYARGMEFAPMEIWCPIISGTLAFALEQAFPQAKLHGVSVVKNDAYRGFGTLHHAPEKFVRAAAIPPPFPSWTYSDAKVWRFAQKHGSEGAVIWNSNA